MEHAVVGAEAAVGKGGGGRLGTQVVADMPIVLQAQLHAEMTALQLHVEKAVQAHQGCPEGCAQFALVRQLGTCWLGELSCMQQRQQEQQVAWPT